MYRQLAHDSSSAHDKQEADIDERVQSAIDMEDPDVIIDLRAHNNHHITMSFGMLATHMWQILWVSQLMIADMIILLIWHWPCLYLTYGIRYVAQCSLS